MDWPILGEYCRNRKQLGIVFFEGNSRLTQIGDLCFSGCSLCSICIPRSVELLSQVDESGFVASHIESIAIDNEQFMINRDLLCDIIDWKAIRYFGWHEKE
jgi:hypothetical protein